MPPTGSGGATSQSPDEGDNKDKQDEKDKGSPRMLSQIYQSSAEWDKLKLELELEIDNLTQQEKE